MNRDTRRLVVHGGVAGALSFLLGLLFSMPIVNPGEYTTIFKTDGGSIFNYGTLEGAWHLAEWKVSAWTYLRGHFVPIGGTVESGGTEADLTYAVEPGWPIFSLIIVILVGAGYVLAAGPESSDPMVAIKRGSAIAVGYAPAAAASTKLLTWKRPPFEAGPGMLSTLLLTAVIAAVLGAVGGYLNHHFGSR